jgi:YrbI family 3-deoxy-D-manno-octulosonate 8-phosphate phosphatase
MKLEQQFDKIELILSDVDGVFTDGGLTFDNQGIETKKFHVRDGLGVKLWQGAGHQFGLLTARTSHIVKVRAKELGVTLVRQGFEHKLPVAQAIASDLGLEREQICYVGDDLADLACIQYAGVGVAVADAVDEVKSEADWITKAGGGKGAIRELVESILKAQKRWNDIVRRYYMA